MFNFQTACECDRQTVLRTCEETDVIAIFLRKRRRVKIASFFLYPRVSNVPMTATRSEFRNDIRLQKQELLWDNFLVFFPCEFHAKLLNGVIWSATCVACSSSGKGVVDIEPSTFWVWPPEMLQVDYQRHKYKYKYLKHNCQVQPKYPGTRTLQMSNGK